jgi:hypothetical protein
MYCLCVIVYCHRVKTQLQLINIIIKKIFNDFHVLDLVPVVYLHSINFLLLYLLLYFYFVYFYCFCVVFVSYDVKPAHY